MNMTTAIASPTNGSIPAFVSEFFSSAIQLQPVALSHM